MNDQTAFRQFPRRQFPLVLAATGLTASGCGTLLYPERVGQGRTGGVNWTVVGLDSIGILLFFIPGVIAFAVDYYNGTMFYPAKGNNCEPTSRELTEVKLDRPAPRLSDVLAALERETGLKVKLEQGKFRSRRLSSRDEFWVAHDEIRRTFDRESATST